ncbi:MFS general substrate transporter [Annulohypoxylon nitens]|nr:MFS general substrate transporter [Annulohypoxylon nitens]
MAERDHYEMNLEEDDDSTLLVSEGLPDSPLSTDQRSRQTPRSSWLTAEKPLAISALACLSIFLWIFSGMLSMVPGTRLAEDIFCRRYYGHDADIDEAMCKVEEVQSQIAYVLGFSVTLTSLCSILVAYPFGVLAERARKPVYLLAATGQCLNVAWSLAVFYFSDVMPIELILLAPVFQLVGGGRSVLITILYTITSDVNTPENKAASYLFLSLSAQVAGFIGPPIGSKLMSIWSPWVPLCLVLVANMLAGALILFIPETAVRRDDPSSNKTTRKGGWYDVMLNHLRSHFRGINSSLRAFKKGSVALLLVVFMLITPSGLGTGPTFLLYFSTRFHRSMVDAGYMLAIKGAFVILVMALILPTLSKILTSPTSPVRLSSFRKDLYLARGSALFNCLGFIALAGPNVGFVVCGLITLTFGSGIGPLCRSLLTSFARPGQTSQTFTLVSMIETIGSLVGGPILAWTFSTGMRLQGFWAGLPYIFLSVLSLMSLGVLFFIIPEKYDGYSRVATEETFRNDEELQDTSLL